jgi:hypothetical protein
MPLGEGDVLDTLGDPIALGMNFRVGPVPISGKSYGIIRDHVRAGNILVVPGTSTLASYSGWTDILTTQTGNPPADVFQRAQLLHECTHALVDVFTGGLNVTRHTGELASYIAQHVYIMRSSPTWAPGTGTDPWAVFYSSVVALIKTYGLETIAGNGKSIPIDVLEPLRLQLVALPHVIYGSYPKTELAKADGLKRMNFFLDDTPAEVSMRSSSVAYETYPDPSDDYLSDVFLEKYTVTDVRGYKGRMKRLRMDFAKCSLARARRLALRFASRIRSDRVSELFHDRLATYERNILLKVLQDRG